jgi:wyosine [tRNA(Phe)-imidazoG37] synthetase (radical SAM superfamily)
VHQHTFERIHRSTRLSIDTLIESLVTLRQRYKGEYWLEVFLLPALNTTEDELDPLREVIHRIGPDRVQLNTLDRPATESWVAAAAQDELERIALFMSEGGLKVDIIGSSRRPSCSALFHDDRYKHINETIRRRPCTPEEIAALTGLHIGEVTKYLVLEVAQGKVFATHEKRGIFYGICRQEEGEPPA